MISYISLSTIVSLYIFFIFGILFNVNLTKTQISITFVILIIATFIVSYNIVPTLGMDLYRYFEFLGGFKFYGIETLSKTDYALTPLTFIYFYIIFLIGEYNLLGSLTAVLILGIIFHISLKFKKNFNIKSRSIMMFIVGVISVSSLIAITTGVRQNAAWATLAIAVYYDYFHSNRNKFNIMLLYTIPLLIHLSTLPFVGLRILFYVFRNFKGISWLIILWPLFLVGVDRLIIYFPHYFQSAFERLGIYSTIDFSVTPKFVGSIFGLLVYGILIFFAFKNKDNKIYSRDFLRFYLMVYFFVITSIFSEHLFMRGFELLTFLALPLFDNLLTSKFLFRRTLVISILTIYIFMFLYQDILPGYFY